MKSITLFLSIVALAGCKDAPDKADGVAVVVTERETPHTYEPIESDRKAYDFVHSHLCRESHHPPSLEWTGDGTRPTIAFDVYYCKSIDGLIFVHEVTK